MKFTLVIFNTYDLFLESEAKARLTQLFLTFKNSLLLPHCLSAKNLFFIDAPVKIYLSIKLVTCFLGNNLAQVFQLLSHHNSILNLYLIIKRKLKTQGK